MRAADSANVSQPFRFSDQVLSRFFGLTLGRPLVTRRRRARLRALISERSTNSEISATHRQRVGHHPIDPRCVRPIRRNDRSNGPRKERASGTHLRYLGAAFPSRWSRCGIDAIGASTWSTVPHHASKILSKSRCKEKTRRSSISHASSGSFAGGTMSRTHCAAHRSFASTPLSVRASVLQMRSQSSAYSCPNASAWHCALLMDLSSSGRWRKSASSRLYAPSIRR
jgi:hypothetical protein